MVLRVSQWCKNCGKRFNECSDSVLNRAQYPSDMNASSGLSSANLCGTERIASSIIDLSRTITASRADVRPMLGLKSIRSATRFCCGYDKVRNLFGAAPQCGAAGICGKPRLSSQQLECWRRWRELAEDNGARPDRTPSRNGRINIQIHALTKRCPLSARTNIMVVLPTRRIGWPQPRAPPPCRSAAADDALRRDSIALRQNHWGDGTRVSQNRRAAIQIQIGINVSVRVSSS
jgi:hypothetical protein